MERIIKDFPEFEFAPGRFFMWSPQNRSIYYDSKRIRRNNGLLALLHEIGHAKLNHRIYKYDAELIRMEMDAWDIARQLAPTYGVRIDEKHITRVVDSYDNWISQRATCPDCSNYSLQKGRDQYGCFACGSIWSVNWRKDRRVKRTVTERYQNPQLAYLGEAIESAN